MQRYMETSEPWGNSSFAQQLMTHLKKSRDDAYLSILPPVLRRRQEKPRWYDWICSTENLNIDELILELATLELNGGPEAFFDIQYLVPTCQCAKTPRDDMPISKRSLSIHGSRSAWRWWASMFMRRELPDSWLSMLSSRTHVRARIVHLPELCK
jgi:hypothetical protein